MGEGFKRKETVPTQREGFVYKWLQTLTPRPERELMPAEDLHDIVEHNTFRGCAWLIDTTWTQNKAYLGLYVGAHLADTSVKQCTAPTFPSTS